MELIDITKFGQIEKGDFLLLEDCNCVFPAIVREVLNSNETGEEIILSKSKNVYFIMENYLNRVSWVLNCKRVVNGDVFNLSNTTKKWKVY